MTQAAMNLTRLVPKISNITSNEQRDRVIARLHVLRDKSTNLDDRFHRVARRMQYWLAGVESGAQWLALFDCIEHDYIRWRIDHDEAVHHMRWLGIDVRPGESLFKPEVEMARRANAARMKAKFNAVRWELDFNRNHANDDYAEGRS